MSFKNKDIHSKAPIYEALMRYKKARVVPFDVPGHKQGRGTVSYTHLDVYKRQIEL